MEYPNPKNKETAKKEPVKGQIRGRELATDVPGADYEGNTDFFKKLEKHIKKRNRKQ